MALPGGTRQIYLLTTENRKHISKYVGTIKTFNSKLVVSCRSLYAYPEDRDAQLAGGAIWRWGETRERMWHSVVTTSPPLSPKILCAPIENWLVVIFMIILPF